MGNENNVFLSPMIYMNIVGRLNADETFLICIRHSLSSLSSLLLLLKQSVKHNFSTKSFSRFLFFMKTTIHPDYRSSRSHLIVIFQDLITKTKVPINDQAIEDNFFIDSRVCLAWWIINAKQSDSERPSMQRTKLCACLTMISVCELKEGHRGPNKVLAIADYRQAAT